MDNKNELVVSEDNLLEMTRMGNLYDKVTENITDCLNSTSKSWISIGYWLLKLKCVDLSLYGYNSIFDYAKDVFGLGNTSVKNMVAVANKFCDFDNYYSQYQCVLKEEYKGFSYSQLVELLSVDELDMNKFDSSMPVAQIRENKILLKVGNIVGDIVDQHVQTLENKLLPLFQEPSNLFKDENGICIADENGQFSMFTLDGAFKFKKSKIEKDICDYRVSVNFSYKCFWTAFKDCYFTINYVFYDSGNNGRSIECYAVSDFKDWDEYLKKQIRLEIDLNDLSSLEEKVKSFISVYIKFLDKYNTKKHDLEQKKEKIAASVKESEDLYKELISIPSFRLGDYIKRFKNYAAIESCLNDLKEHFTITDDSIISVKPGYSYMYVYMYLNLIDDYYVDFSYYGISLYQKITVDNVDSKNNRFVNGFKKIDYSDIKFSNFVLQYLKDNIKNFGQLSDQK